ncbi:hypothetical protein QCA50_001220 [Cerrena zonata]|uniref:Uncharacterized protein n=1 Tax=Cerrena zonata TaxID=2478898 RepID=A0AAW0GUU5_9APHY
MTWVSVIIYTPSLAADFQFCPSQSAAPLCQPSPPARCLASDACLLSARLQRCPSSPETQTAPSASSRFPFSSPPPERATLEGRRSTVFGGVVGDFLNPRVLAC